MPVILDPDDWPPWLDPTIGDPGELLGLLGPHRADDLLAVPLGSGVNCPPLGPGMARVLSREQYSCATVCRSSLALRGQRVIGFERREVDGGQAPRYR